MQLVVKRLLLGLLAVGEYAGRLAHLRAAYRHQSLQLLQVGLVVVSRYGGAVLYGLNFHWIYLIAQSDQGGCCLLAGLLGQQLLTLSDGEIELLSAGWLVLNGLKLPTAGQAVLRVSR